MTSHPRQQSSPITSLLTYTHHFYTYLQHHTPHPPPYPTLRCSTSITHILQRNKPKCPQSTSPSTSPPPTSNKPTTPTTQPSPSAQTIQPSPLSWCSWSCLHWWGVGLFLMYVFTQLFSFTCFLCFAWSCVVLEDGAMVGKNRWLTDLNNRNIHSARRGLRARGRIGLKRVSSWRI